ncbi:MAG: helix-turn-helix domain-containing protein [Planctomycetaceae bacterium]|nr:helix-turn-helix domain-containing protein [Planctomycetaceae bacterium]
MPKVHDFLQVQEVAKLLGVSPNTVRNWGREDKLPEFRHPVNNYRLYRRQDVEKMLHALQMPKRTR